MSEGKPELGKQVEKVNDSLDRKRKAAHVKENKKRGAIKRKVKKKLQNTPGTLRWAKAQKKKEQEEREWLKRKKKKRKSEKNQQKKSRKANRKKK